MSRSLQQLLQVLHTVNRGGQKLLGFAEVNKLHRPWVGLLRRAVSSLKAVAYSEVPESRTIPVAAAAVVVGG